ncbi:MAG: hypothetical protein RLZZ524_2472 [Pseudomonadota bacterium]
MPSINRTTIIAGPALIKYNTTSSFWSKGDVELKVINDRFDIQTAHFGKVDERFSDRRIEVTFEPSGAVTSTLAAVLWPWGGTTVGTSILTGTDKPLEIISRDGRKITVHAAAVTKMPTLRLGVSNTLIGPVTFTGLIKNNTDPTNASAYYTEAPFTYPGDTGFAVADIKTAAASAVWGAAAPWSSFVSENGFEIDFDLQLAPQKVDGIGTVDMTFQSLAVTLKAIPVGPAALDILAKIAPTSGLGASIAGADNLTVTAGTVAVVLSKPAIVESGLMFGSQVKRIGSTVWTATRTVTTGTPDALFTLTVS